MVKATDQKESLSILRLDHQKALDTFLSITSVDLGEPR